MTEDRGQKTEAFECGFWKADCGLKGINGSEGRRQRHSIVDFGMRIADRKGYRDQRSEDSVPKAAFDKLRSAKVGIWKRDKSKLECHRRNTPIVDSSVFGAGWSLPALPIKSAIFGGHSPPYDKKFSQC